MSATIWGALTFLLLRTDVPALNLPKLDPADYFAPAELDRMLQFRTVTLWFWIASTLIELGVLALLAWRGRRVASLVRCVLRLPRSARVRCGVAVAACCLFAVWFTALPVGMVRHWWYRRYGLTEQGYGAWVVDRALELLVATVVVVLAVGLAVYLAARFGRHWWLVGSAAIVVLGALIVLAQPLVIEPLFNRFAPISDRNLAAQIETLGKRLGVGVESVDVSDASRRTTMANASVTGIGSTRHIVLHDTLLDGRFTEEEILWVSAHELAHVARGHVWKGVAWFALFAIPGLAAIAWITERRGGVRDPAVIPLALLCTFALSVFTLPAQNSVLRHYEREADWIALRVTNDPASQISTQLRFARTALADPDPPAWALIVLGSHPTTMQRIEMAKAVEGS
ncbi:M48 family metalloprotease [Mycolicibacterium celeriflavum]|uniref:M48 family metalloprotease n=1 Tax=Mycolicibacterium celeriflavum TaxID=1249101 RepID=UPI003CEFF409